MVTGYDWRVRISQECVEMHCDDQSSTHLNNHQIYHDREKKIDIFSYY